MENQSFFEGSWSDMAFHMEFLFRRSLTGMSLLDVGCGWAQCLLYFSKKGMDCYGFDPAPEAVEYGLRKGLNLRLAGMEKMDVFDGLRFDVVMLNNVLEHLADPVEVVTEIRRDLLEPGGLLIIDVPNEFNLFQMAGRDVNGLHDWWIAPPAHLNYFSRNTLQRMLQACGYEVRIAEASFPLEMFLLFGDCYVGNNTIGQQCHQKRVAFEVNLRKAGYETKLREFYQALANINLGRQIKLYATAI